MQKYNTSGDASAIGHESGNVTHGVGTVTCLVNSVISNGYCISAAFCGVTESILYLEVVFFERRFFGSSGNIIHFSI